MTEGDAAADATDGIPVTLELEIVDGRTVIEVEGDRDAAVIVRSASGQRIYLPPEDFERSPESARTTARGSDATAQDASPASDSPYQSPGSADSPYQSAASDSPYQSPGSADSPYQSPTSDSPYQRADGQYDSLGLDPTADGFRIVHPEPVTDVRLIR